jgi:hypothetical protein
MGQIYSMQWGYKKCTQNLMGREKLEDTGVYGSKILKRITEN